MFNRVLTLLATSFLTLTAYAVDGNPMVESSNKVADSGTGNPAQQQSNPMVMILLMVGVFAVMWFLLIRPQKKEEKRRQELISATKRGDKVVTIGGLHGTVEAVGEQTIDLKVGEDGKNGIIMTFNKTAVLTNVTASTTAADAAKK